MNKIELILAVMTPKQRRRWRLYLKGKKLSEIASIEGVGYQRIQKSLHFGKKRAEKILGPGGYLGGVLC